MATLPNPHTWIAGDDALSSYLQTLSDGINFLKDTPLAVVFQGTGTALVTATITAVAFDTEEADTDAIHSTSTNTSRMTIVTPGRYRFLGMVTFPSSATGFRQVFLRKNGATAYGQQLVNNAGATPMVVQAADEILLSAGDYVELMAQQTSGGTLTTTTGRGGTMLIARWVGVS